MNRDGDGGARTAGLRRIRRAWSIAGGLVALLALVFVLDQWTAVPRSLHAAVDGARRALRRPEAAHVVWEAADPDQEGLRKAALDSLRLSLAGAGTEAFLVVRGDHLVYEWYAPGFGPNVRYGMAAMAKAVTASMAFLVAATDGRTAFEDPAWKFIPAWRTDSVRSRIRIRDLTSHRSGIDDVDFGLGAEGRLQGWKRTYYEHRGERFRMALETAPILSPPGTRASYSGVGYYALAYALAASLRGAPEPDVRTLLRERIMRPLGVPDEDWRLSYGESYRVDGMTLYAIGSGASYTARAVARVGELMLDRGRWGGRWLFDSSLVTRALEPGSDVVEPDSGAGPPTPVAAQIGWVLNIRGSWPAVPRDAFAGVGAGDEAVLVVPSLDLVMVRMGKRLSPDSAQIETALRDRLFDPLMGAVTGASSRMRVVGERSLH